MRMVFRASLRETMRRKNQCALLDSDYILPAGITRPKRSESAGAHTHRHLLRHPRPRA